jgi:hypothetical protein
VHRDPLELQHHRARQLVLRIELVTRELLDRRRVRPGVRDRRVAGDRLAPRRERARVALEQARLDAAVLIAELDLEVDHVLAEAHEAKRARLDHARVDRPDGDLVHLLAVDAIERIRRHRGLICALEAHRLEPGVSRDPDPELLVELALEAVQRRHARGQLVVAACGIDRGPRDLQPGTILLDDRQHHAGVVAAPVQRDRTQPGMRALDELRGPRLGRQHLDLRDRCGERDHRPSNEWATSVINALICGGM